MVKHIADQLKAAGARLPPKRTQTPGKARTTHQGAEIDTPCDSDEPEPDAPPPCPGCATSKPRGMGRRFVAWDITKDQADHLAAAAREVGITNQKP